jgi:hypothetical protein
MPAKFDVSAAVKVAERLAEFPKRQAQAEARAISSTTRALPAETKRSITADYGIKPSRVTSDVVVRRVDNVIELTGYDRPIGLLNYNAKVSKSGVSVTVLKSEGAQKLRHAFKAKGLSDNVQIFERRGQKRPMQKGRYKGLIRQPIKTLYAPSVGQIVRNPALQSKLADFVMQKLTAEITRQLRIL